MSNLEPKIYVACLAAYNNGYLHGAWIDADQSKDDIIEAIQAMLKTSPVADTECCEEWAIHDYQDFGEAVINENEDIETVSQLGQAIAEYGPAIAAYYSYYNTIQNFEDYYRGEYASEEDFVYDWFEQTGQLEAIEKAGLDSCFIDFEKIAFSFFVNDFYSVPTERYSIYVFDRH